MTNNSPSEGRRAKNVNRQLYGGFPEGLIMQQKRCIMLHVVQLNTFFFWGGGGGVQTPWTLPMDPSLDYDPPYQT